VNFLSHHHVARLAEGKDAPPAFYVGNVLPDLLSMEPGGGRLRAVHLAGATGDIARGARLHLAADRAFHAAPAFHEATADVSARLRAASFSAPPPRVFFLAHVFVELALDAVLLGRDPTLAEHFYAQFNDVNVQVVADEAAALARRPLPRLAATLARFARARYLFDYATAEGLARALSRVVYRANLAAFAATDADHRCLAAIFTDWEARAAVVGPALWKVPPAAPVVI